MRILHITYYILHITYYILHITYYILHITYYILYITYYILHITYYILHIPYSGYFSGRKSFVHLENFEGLCKNVVVECRLVYKCTNRRGLLHLW